MAQSKPKTKTAKKSQVKSKQTAKKKNSTKKQIAKRTASKGLPEKVLAKRGFAVIRGQILVLDKNGKSQGVFPAYAIDQKLIAVRFGDKVTPLTLENFTYRANFFGKRSYFEVAAVDARINLVILATRKPIFKIPKGYNLTTLDPEKSGLLQYLWPRLVRLELPDTSRLPASLPSTEAIIRDGLQRAQGEIISEITAATKAVTVDGGPLAIVPEDSVCSEISGSKGAFTVQASQSVECRSSVTSELGRTEKLFWVSESGSYRFDQSSDQQTPDLGTLVNLVGSKHFDELRQSAANLGLKVVCGTYELSSATTMASYCTRSLKNTFEFFDTVVVIANQTTKSNFKYSVIRTSGLNSDNTKRVAQQYTKYLGVSLAGGSR